MRRIPAALAALALLAMLPAAAAAHFGMIIPSDSMVTQGEGRSVQLEISFSHPFAMVGMDMARPRHFGVLAGGRRLALTDTLAPAAVIGADGWRADYTLRRPGAHVFFVEPAPYWEPAENAFIVHYTKTVVAAFGDDEGWDAELGLKTEIVPLARPFGLWAGNVFQGVVKVDGKPVPFAEVEVEYYNRRRAVAAPAEVMATQRLRADANGVFTYAAPRAGWWGFAALSTADFQLEHDGKPREVELGAVIWVEFHPMP